MIYAATSADGTMYNSWTSLRANQPSMLTRYFPWLDYTGDDDVYRANVQPATGAYNPEDGKYYVMLTFVYDCIWDAKNSFNYVPQHWYSIDLAGGTAKPVESGNWKEWSKEKGWTTYSLDPQADHWGLWMDMSFDPVEGTMYALAQSEEKLTEDNPFHSAIVKVNLHDGTYRVAKELRGHYYLGFAYDLDGRLYAARWTTDAQDQINGSVIVELDRDTYAEIATVSNLTRNGEPFKLCYNGTLDVDRATGELYYAGANFDNGLQSLFKINTKTGECTYLGGLSYDNITGMHIPYVGASDRNAPARVSNLRTEFAADGANSITIKWTNPTTKWNLEDLTSISGVKIYRDDMNGTPIADVKDNTTPGSEASYVDNDATQGLHTYYVVAYNEKGDGISDQIAAFVGRDTPDAPINVDGYGSGTTSAIQWEAPTQGLHNGWFDKTTVKYKVTRSDGVVVAENEDVVDYDGTFMAFDNMLNDAPMTMYSYTVTASNVDGEGGSATSREWMAGSAYQAPYKFDFNNPTDKGSFSGYAPGAWTGWEATTWGDPAWALNLNDGFANLNDYLLTPQINVKAGHLYRVRWNVRFDQNTNNHTFELTAGETNEAQKAFAECSFDETVTGNVYQETEFSGVYTAEADGKNMFGLHATTTSGAWDKISVLSVAIEEVFGKDVEARTVSGYPRINRSQAQNYIVSVYNSGTSEVSGFKVETGYVNRKGEFNSLGETTYDKALAVDETVKVSVPVTVDYESGTQFDLCARVTLEGDEYAGNDISESIRLNVEEIAGAAGFNAEFVGGKLSTGDGYGDTHVPFTTYSPNTTSVTIYPAELLVTSEAAPYEISRIGFTAFSKINIDPCDVKVYMGTTDDEMFTGSPVTNVISPSDLELVYDGKSTSMIAGFDGLSINLDTPYMYNGVNNLVVALETVCHSGSGDFHLFWNTWDREVGKYQSLKTNALKWVPADVTKWDGMPDLHLALKSFVGIDGISPDATFGLALSGRTVIINGNAEALRVYDLAGRMLGAYDVNGLNRVTLNVPDGIYLIKAVDAAGNARTLKAAVR